MKVAILLSTFNGEVYLRNQLDSLLSQTYNNLCIYIRDDGSKDQTIEILKEYKEKDNRIFVDFSTNKGYSMSFFTMLQNVEADIYAFCDQDDFWMPDKIERAVNVLQNKNEPTLWFSNIEICDGNLNHITYGNTTRFYSFENSLFTCVAPGMSMVFNNSLRKLIIEKDTSNIKDHDFWTYRVASAFGNVIFDSKPLIKYRRHGNNVSEYSYNSLQRYILGIKRVLYTDIYKNTKNEIKIFKQMYSDQLSDDRKRTICLFANSSFNINTRFKKLLFKKKLKDNIVNEGLLRILLFVGIV